MNVSAVTMEGRMTEHHAQEPLLHLHLKEMEKRGLSPRSIKERRYAILRTGRLLGHPVATANADELSSWQDRRSQMISRNGQRMTAAAVRNEIAHIAQYARWLQRVGHRTDDAGIHLIRPKLPTRLPHPLPVEEVRLAYQAATGDPVMRAWIGLAAFCGLRCMEIAGLKREYVERSGKRPRLRVIGKGDKERYVPLPADVLADLRVVGLKGSGFVFARIDGIDGAPSPARVSERINAYLDGLDISLRAHSMRHAFGTGLYERTKDPYLVAEVMGHGSTDTTRGYVKVNAQDAAAAIEQMARETLDGLDESA